MNNPRQQNYRTKLCLLAALFISPTALADEALSRRERTATQKTIETTILAQYHGNYQVVRDQQYHGEHGLVKALDAWMADTYAWMGKWATLLALVDQAGTVPYARIESEAQSLIQQQDAALKALEQSAEAIRIKAEAARKTLARREIPTAETLTPYQEVITTLKRRFSELSDAFANLADQARSRTDELTEVRRVTEQVALAKLRAALLAAGRPDLQQSVARFREMLDAERILGAAFVELSELEKTAIAHSTSLRLYRLEANVQAADRVCASLRQTIAMETLARRYKESALARSDRQCGAIAALYRDLLAIDSAAVIVSDYADTVKVRAKSACSHDAAPVICEKFAVLAAIPSERVRQMSPTQLAAYENEWVSVEEALP